ncbi:hypothetical protein ACCS81_07680 [Rhizobium ruizarguesonis]
MTIVTTHIVSTLCRDVQAVRAELKASPSVARALVLQKATATMNRKAAALRATFKVVEGTPPLLRLPPP